MSPTDQLLATSYRLETNRGIADWAAKNVGKRYHPVSERPVESEMLT